MIDRLKALSPSDFENVVFDLVAAAGLVNAVWRTPGPDQGRDIEGQVHRVDFSGAFAVEKWYVECKRHESSLDWPTVWQKIAYADGHSADGLLIVTTAVLSPQCKTEVSNWNRDRRSPKVRFWDATVLEAVLLRHPIVVARHSISDSVSKSAPAFLDLSRQTAKYVQAAFGRATLTAAVTSELESAAASAELLTSRLESFQRGRATPAAFSLNVDAYDWLVLEGDPTVLTAFDRYGLRAMLTLLRYSQRADRVRLVLAPSGVRVPIGQPLYQATIEALNALAIWAGIEIAVHDTEILLSARSP